VDSQFVFRCNLHPVTRTGWSSNRRVRSGGVRIWDDPATDQFLSVDPDVAETGQPYAFTGDDPLNATDPLGLIKYRIQEFGEGFTKVVDIKKERYEHVNVHVKQMGITKKQYYNALLETLRIPVHITDEGDNTLKYSGPVELVEQNAAGQTEQVLKRQVMVVFINSNDGNVATSYVTSNKKAIADNWNQSPWIDSHPDVDPYRG
jgi:hypothetical protein